MRKFRHKSLDYFYARPMPEWGGNLGDIDFDNIFYYLKPVEEQARSWDDLPDGMRSEWDIAKSVGHSFLSLYAKWLAEADYDFIRDPRSASRYWSTARSHWPSSLAARARFKR